MFVRYIFFWQNTTEYSKANKNILPSLFFLQAKTLSKLSHFVLYLQISLKSKAQKRNLLELNISQKHLKFSDTVLSITLKKNNIFVFQQNRNKNKKRRNMQILVIASAFSVAMPSKYQLTLQNKRQNNKVPLLKNALFIIQYKQKMIQPTLMPFLKKRVQNRWTQDEFNRLLKTIQAIEPVDPRGWQKVTQKMHELGPQRQTKSYKQKFNNYLEKKESLQVRKVPLINKNILKYFNEGRSPYQISTLIKISIFLVKKLLKAILIKIQKYIARIIGHSMQKKISHNDFHFFAYALKQNLELTSLTKVQNLCEHWNALKDSKNDYKTNHPKLYEKTLEYIKRKLIMFNSNLNLCWTYYQDHLAQNIDLAKESKKKYQENTENCFSQLFLPSSHFLEKVEISEEESQMSIQPKYLEAGLQEGKFQYLKSESLSTCESTNKQSKQNNSNEYKFSDFIHQKIPIQSFLPTFQDISFQNDDYSRPEISQRHFSFDFRAQNDQYFFSGEDDIFADKYK